MTETAYNQSLAAVCILSEKRAGWKFHKNKINSSRHGGWIEIMMITFGGGHALLRNFALCTFSILLQFLFLWRERSGWKSRWLNSSRQPGRRPFFNISTRAQSCARNTHTRKRKRRRGYTNVAAFLFLFAYSYSTFRSPPLRCLRVCAWASEREEKERGKGRRRRLAKEWRIFFSR